jgi:mono/diheme cytochrome c family protein
VVNKSDKEIGRDGEEDMLIADKARSIRANMIRPHNLKGRWGTLQDLGLVLALFSILALVGSCGQSQPPAIDANPLRALTHVYETNCAVCHGANRQGITELGPALTSQSLAELSDAEVRDTILNGRPGTAMVGFTDRLSQEEIDALLQLIK